MTNDLLKLKIAADSRPKKDPTTRDRRKWIAIGLGLVAVFIATIYRYTYYAVPVTVRPLEVRELGLPPIILTAGGYIVADPQVTVSSKVSGQITKLLVKEGDEVTAGQLLAVIGAEDFAAQHESTHRAHDIASEQYRRIKTLFDAGVSSKRELELAELEMKSAEASYKSAKFNDDQSRMVSPISGTIIRRLRKEGEYLSPGLSSEGEPGTSILTIGNLSRMRVELDITEGDISKLALDKPVLVFPDAFPDAMLSGHVVEISPMADRQKSVVPVKIQLENNCRDAYPPGHRLNASHDSSHIQCGSTSNGEKMLKPEMSARVVFLASKMQGKVERSVLLPESAIRRVHGKPNVFVLENDRAVLRPVELGDRVDQSWKVKSGVNAGTAVVIDPPFILRNGRRIEVKSE